MVFKFYKNLYGFEIVKKIYLSILYAKKNSYELEFSIEDFEIKDNLKESTIKRLLAKRKNIYNHIVNI